MLCRIASSLLFIPYLLHNQYRRGSLTQDNHPPTCATLLLHPRLGSTPIPFCVGIGCVTIRLFEAPDKTICSLYTLVCLCMPPSQASLFRSSDFFLQLDRGFDMLLASLLSRVTIILGSCMR